METIYLERQAAAHPRAEAILAAHPRALVVPIDRYAEIFNRGRQSFRLQKKHPCWILARKRGRLVLDAPYGIGGLRNYYFSHVLNCLYDCRYCFLQGMYRSAHYVLFVNYEDFQTEILETAAQWPDERVTFFSGYDGDSLVFDGVTGFVSAFLPFFARHPRLLLELRTKSVRIRPLLEHGPIDNCVVAFSFTPEAVSRKLEGGVPPVELRLGAMRRLAERGFRLGLRFDPLVYLPGFEGLYRELFHRALDAVPAGSLHSVGLGLFRLPKEYSRRMARLYPEERLFAGPLEERSGRVSYEGDLEAALRGFCREELLARVPREKLFEY